MEEYLQSLGFDIQKSVQNVYNYPKTDIVDIDDIILYENNAREKDAILCGLAYSEFTKITH